jgi:hypothetical protein
VLIHIGYAPDSESAVWKAKQTITLNAAKPFKISSSNTITIEAEVELGEAFAKGWDKLPDEL